MANTFITPKMVARAALANLYETCVMAGLVHRDYDGEFTGARGATVTVRKPPIFQANEFDPNTGIVVQDATEDSVDVTLNHHADTSFSVTSKQLTMEIEDFSAELLDPAMESISQKIDKDILSLRDDITAEVGQVAGANKYALTDPKVAIDAGRVLTQANVPETQRRVVLGPITTADWLGSDLFSRADARGDTAGLQEANLGRRVFGFDPYKTQHISVPPVVSGTSTTEVGVAFHRTAFALVTRPLALPKGAAQATTMSYKGFSVRVVYDYDIHAKVDVVSVDCLYGCKTLDSSRAVLIKGADNV